jgi:hypothetical protein
MGTTSEQQQQAATAAAAEQPAEGETTITTAESSSSSSSKTPILQDEGDLDGIGAIFASTTTTTTSPTTKTSTTKLTPLDPSQWAYDSGKVIEQGAVILGGVEQEYGFGLRQQYFHKAAILVLDHDERQFTKGIILNRPTDLVLEDDVNAGVQWRIWFGGDVQGMDSPHPDIVCLHSLKNEQATKASIPVMKDIQVCLFHCWIVVIVLRCVFAELTTIYRIYYTVVDDL